MFGCFFLYLAKFDCLFPHVAVTRISRPWPFATHRKYRPWHIKPLRKKKTTENETVLISWIQLGTKVVQFLAWPELDNTVIYDNRSIYTHSHTHIYIWIHIEAFNERRAEVCICQFGYLWLYVCLMEWFATTFSINPTHFLFINYLIWQDDSVSSHSIN